ncbi:MAG: NERD domain-containing protein [Pleurocapsa minor GSE-CHR-MK-17-07R]|jgi:hypothetical protein|nr:NERD domain-containing protein [Pleurocapsa minor GSE-CHR-MK 17-07R]
MRTVTNAKIARRNKSIAQYGFFASFIVPLAGIFLLNQQTMTPATGDVLLSVVLPFMVLPIAYIVMIFAIRMSNLWVRQPRPENVIEAGAKGLGNKAVLYNYFHFPARHVIISPLGVFAIITRFQDGSYSVDGRKWTTNKSAMGRILSVFRMDAMGDPTAEAERAAAHVKSLLAPIAPDVPVQPLVIFVDPRVQLEVTNPEVPVLYADSKNEPTLKSYFRDITKEKRPTLTQEQIDAFEENNLKV